MKFRQQETPPTHKMTSLSKDPIFQLCDVIRETAFALHRYHGPGHLEKIYEKGLANRLRKEGLNVEQQAPLQVFDEDGSLLGEYFADLYVEKAIIVELKAVRTVTNEHAAQILGYLRSSRCEHGLLLNFGAGRFYIKKFVLSEALEML